MHTVTIPNLIAGAAIKPTHQENTNLSQHKQRFQQHRSWDARVPGQTCPVRFGHELESVHDEDAQHIHVILAISSFWVSVLTDSVITCLADCFQTWGRRAVPCHAHWYGPHLPH